LSERLQALGRPALSRRQLRAVAEVLARQAGYDAVYDRPDRRFWQDVLEPIVGGEPLSVAEVFYLRDVMLEDLGPRRQGQRLELSALRAWVRGFRDYQVDDPRGYVVDLAISRNPRLDLQWELRSTWQWTRSYVDAEVDRRVRSWTNELAVLWLLADRWRLDTVASAGFAAFEQGVRSTQDTYGLDLSFAWYVEDRILLRPFAEGTYWHREYDDTGRQTDDYSWRYGIAFELQLDAALF
jgi:hypothetical protein